jgi:SAM-dependent methyltransferase
MPDEELWASFFNVETVLDRLALLPCAGDVVEFGCGYGTFTIPAARRTSGIVHALDIEPEMVNRTSRRANACGLRNVRPVLRDFIAEGTGLDGLSADYAMLFNILHADEPSVLLLEARCVLRPGGLLGIMHWNYDPATPRGPSMEIRPRPEHCREWACDAGFKLLPPGIIDLPPYHYGMLLAKPPEAGL